VSSLLPFIFVIASDAGVIAMCRGFPRGRLSRLVLQVVVSLPNVGATCCHCLCLWLDPIGSSLLQGCSPAVPQSQSSWRRLRHYGRVAKNVQDVTQAEAARLKTELKGMGHSLPILLRADF
jgi:hypothetical protein